MSDENQPSINIDHADSVTVEPTQEAPAGVPADAPTQETPESPPEPSFQASPADFKSDSD